MIPYNAQLVEIQQGLALHADRMVGKLARIEAEIAFANRLAAAHPEHAEPWRETILKAGSLVDEGLRKGSSPRPY